MTSARRMMFRIFKETVLSHIYTVSSVTLTLVLSCLWCAVAVSLSLSLQTKFSVIYIYICYKTLSPTYRELSRCVFPPSPPSLSLSQKKASAPAKARRSNREMQVNGRCVVVVQQVGRWNNDLTSYLKGERTKTEKPKKRKIIN
jgi:hypothetical protein